MGFNQRLYMYSKSNYFKIVEHDEKIQEYNNNDKNLKKIGIIDIFYEKFNDIRKVVISNISRYKIEHSRILKKYLKNSYLLEGIIVGDIDNVEDEIKENFKDINSYHLLAISGSHMAYLLIIIDFMVKRIKLRKICHKFNGYIINYNVYNTCRIFTCCFKSRNICCYISNF
jgi:hypothetical protein